MTSYPSVNKKGGQIFVIKAKKVKKGSISDLSKNFFFHIEDQKNVANKWDLKRRIPKFN